MPWDNKNGGPWNNNNPWGSNKNSGNNNFNGKNKNDDFEKMFNQFNKKINNFFSKGPKSILIAFSFLVFCWIISGFYTISPEEQGVVLRFGKFTSISSPGLNYHYPTPVEKVIKVLESIADEIGASVADIIVLAGNVGIEKASGLSLPFTPGRGDASQNDTDIDSFSVLEPTADAFRNFRKDSHDINVEEMMLDKSHLMNLTAPEMTVLVGGMRTLGISNNGYGVFTDNKDKLTNDFFSTLLDMSVEWKPNGSGDTYEAFDRISGQKVRMATSVDLVFGSNSQLRALAEVYASDDGQEKFLSDFTAAWTKVMEIDIQ